jgi:GNAT superfamily N-acetyltransferase
MRPTMTKKLPLDNPGLEFEACESADVAARLSADIAARHGPREETPLSITMRDGAGALLGGLNGVTHWRWLYIKHLWVAEPQRGRGLAKRLMEEAERAARDRGAIGAYIDTFDHRVAAFYERLGYVRAGAIANFPPGGQRIYLSKKLEDQSALFLP